MLSKLPRLTERFPLPAVVFYLIATTPLGFAAGMYIDNKYLLPLISALLFFPIFVIYLSAERYRATLMLSLLWALLLSVMMVLATTQNPQMMGELTINGTDYTDEMFTWIKTGEGAEGNPVLFLPQHALHLLIYIPTTVISGGFVGLVMGTILLNYMNFYVGMLATASTNSALISLIGWPPWALLRVVGYISLAIALSQPLWNLVGERRLTFNWRTPYLWWGLGLVAADAFLKWLLAESWRELLLCYFRG